MEKSTCEEINKTENSPKRLSENSQEDLFQSIEYDQRANSDRTPSIDSNSENGDYNQCIKNYSNNSSFILENSRINQHSIENNGNNPINVQTSINQINEIQDGSKGCFPFENMEQNNSMNNCQNYDSLKNNLKPKNKLVKYRCSKCDFISTDSEEFNRHLSDNNHYSFPKKIIANNFYKLNNRINFKYKKNKKHYFCKYCGIKFDSSITLNIHLNAHRHNCDICNRLFGFQKSPMRCIHNNGFYYENLKKYQFTKYDNQRKKPQFKKIKWKNDEISENNDFEESYAFIEDSDGNFDFNKMIKLSHK
jgi:hypothetical protein